MNEENSFGQRQEHRISLPVSPAPFVGRTTELAQIAHRLSNPDCRLLTLIGPGGIGKTRLALASAEAHSESFPDGLVFIPLTTLTDPTLLPNTIAQGLGIALTGGDEPVNQLGRLLQNKRMLLVLDNFEQLLPRAELLAAWLRQAPDVKWLVTSQERLNLVEEWLLPVRGLEQPEDGVALFVQSARRVRPDFSLAGQEAAVSQICTYVDGMPLAIELAASWTAVLSCEQILAQMEQSFDILATNLRNVPPRHRSLRHLFDQTWRLLPPLEKDVLMKLSVFRGGFDSAAAEDVANADLLLLLALANKSLITAEGHGRYNLHGLTRHYVAGKLQDSGTKTNVQQQHATYFLQLAAHAAATWRGPQQTALLDHLESEHDNLRAALAWCKVADVETGLQLAAAIWRFWQLRGHIREGRQHLADLLAAGSSESETRARALIGAGYLALLQDAHEEAQQFLLESLAWGQAHNNHSLIAAATYSLGMAARHHGDEEQAEKLLASSLALWRELEDHVGIYTSLYNLADIARLQRNYELAQALHEESLALKRAQKDYWSIAYSLLSLGLLAQFQRHYEQALSRLREASQLFLAAKDRLALAETLEALAETAVRIGQPEQAATLFGTTEALRELINQPLSATIIPDYEKNVQHIRTALPESLFGQAWSAGRTLADNHGAAAVAFAQTIVPAEPVARQSAPPAGLTAREFEVLQLVAQGLTDAQVAEQLVISPRTVSTHLQRIYNKLGVTNRSAATRYVLEYNK